MEKAIVFVSAHAKARLNERFKTTNFRKFVTSDVRFYNDRFDVQKYYLNMSEGGFMVLAKLRANKFLIKTITERGQIDDRSYEVFDRVIIND